MQRRNTNQRQIVYKAIELFGHVSTENLVEYLRDNNDDISLATIYRNLNILLEEGQINKVKLEGVDVFETVKEKHYHFVCKCCNDILDISPDLLMVDIKKDFLENTIEKIDVNLYGICDRCKQKHEGE